MTEMPLQHHLVSLFLLVSLEDAIRFIALRIGWDLQALGGVGGTCEAIWSETKIMLEPSGSKCH